MAKKVTFTAPYTKKKFVEVETSAPVGKVIQRVIDTDPNDGSTTVSIQVALYDEEGNFLDVIGPFRKPWDDKWKAKLDALDTLFLELLQDAELPAGTVGSGG